MVVYRIEPHRLQDRIRGKLLFLPACVRLALLLRRRNRHSELWIGDSHAMTFKRSITNSMFMRAPGGALIIRDGPRLMYSIARRGFGDQVMRLARVIGRFGVQGAFLPVFSAGDIDVRSHIPDHPGGDFGFVAEYVVRCAEVAETMHADRFVIFMPPPPVDVSEEAWFPVSGTIEQRLAAFRQLREALIPAVAGHPKAELLDLTSVLTGPGGGMPVTFTDDGAHATVETRRLVRPYLREQLGR